MRPTTGLKDMFFDMDPGTKAAGEFEEGETVTVANTAPDVNLDEVLEILDGDTQAYLRLLLVGAGKGLEGRDKELGELLGGLGPINKDLKQLNTRGREAADEPPQPRPQLQHPHRPDRPERRRPRPARGRVEHRARLDRRAGPERAARRQAAARHPPAGGGDPQRADRLRRRPRPDLQRPAPVRAQPRRGERLARQPRPLRPPRCSRTRCARSCAPPASRSRT